MMFAYITKKNGLINLATYIARAFPKRCVDGFEWFKRMEIIYKIKGNKKKGGHYYTKYSPRFNIRLP